MRQQTSLQQAAINRRFCVAPMMRRSDRHFRFLARLLSRCAVLYSEMVCADALLRGHQQRLLAFSPEERPLALQIAGRNPQSMARCAALAEEAGYNEVNINVGCPSAGAQAGGFGVCLMAEPQRVADCLAAMIARVSIVVSVKCRLGIGRRDHGESVYKLLDLSQRAGCRVFIIHARQAVIGGHFSSKKNRTVPPLDYQAVYAIKRRWPAAEIILNGGLTDLHTAQRAAEPLDGVMVGRAAYSNPWMLTEVDRMFYGQAPGAPISRTQPLKAYLRYAESQMKEGAQNSLCSITRHAAGLFHGQANAKRWRQRLCATP